jgi:hypothetical protein
MNELIEAGDPRTKVVGKRHVPLSNAEKFAQVQKQFRQQWPTLPFPKGVHRFKTEEEAHQWKEKKMLQRSQDRRNEMTSSPSVES